MSGWIGCRSKRPRQGSKQLLAFNYEQPGNSRLLLPRWLTPFSPHPHLCKAATQLFSFFLTVPSPFVLLPHGITNTNNYLPMWTTQETVSLTPNALCFHSHTALWCQWTFQSVEAKNLPPNPSNSPQKNTRKKYPCSTTTCGNGKLL